MLSMMCPNHADLVHHSIWDRVKWTGHADKATPRDYRP